MQTFALVALLLVVVYIGEVAEVVIIVEANIVQWRQ